MRLAIALLLTAILATSATAFPFKLPFFHPDSPPTSNLPSYNVAPLLSSTEAVVIPDRYIVVLKKDLPTDHVTAHQARIAEACNHYGGKTKRDSLGGFFKGVKNMFDV